MFPIKDTVPNRTFPSTTWTLIILCGVVFLFETTLPQELLEEFTYYFGIVPAEYTKRHRHGLPLIDYLSFLTTMFLHGGWLHFLGNMWFLKIFGSKVEDRMGHGRFLVFYLIAGVLASMFYIHFSPGSSMPVIGASGAIAGVMGAYYVLFPTGKNPYIHPDIHYPVVYRAAGGLFFGVVVSAAAFFRDSCPGAAFIRRRSCVVGPHRGFYRRGFAGLFFQKTVQAITLRSEHKEKMLQGN